MGHLLRWTSPLVGNRPILLRSSRSFKGNGIAGRVTERGKGHLEEPGRGEMPQDHASSQPDPDSLLLRVVGAAFRGAVDLAQMREEGLPGNARAFGNGHGDVVEAVVRPSPIEDE